MITRACNTLTCFDSFPPHQLSSFQAYCCKQKPQTMPKMLLTASSSQEGFPTPRDAQLTQSSNTCVRRQSEAKLRFPLLWGGTCPLEQVCYWNILRKEARSKGGTAGIDDGHILALTIIERKKVHFSAKAALLLAQVKDPALVLTPMCRRNRVVSRFNHSPKDGKQAPRKWLQTCHPLLTAVVLPSSVFLLCKQWFSPSSRQLVLWGSQPLLLKKQQQIKVHEHKLETMTWLSTEGLNHSGQEKKNPKHRFRFPTAAFKFHSSPLFKNLFHYFLIITKDQTQHCLSFKNYFDLKASVNQCIIIPEGGVIFNFIFF